MIRRIVSRRAEAVTESGIRDMMRQAVRYEAIDLSPGIPEYSIHPEIKRAAIAAIEGNFNQYAISCGSKRFRDALAAKVKNFSGLDIDPDQEICVTCGSTEALMSAMLGIIDPGDEVIVFSPHYENYVPDTEILGAVAKIVQLRPPDWSFDSNELADAFNNNTRAIIICNPNNPTGKVFTRDELGFIAELCRRWDVIAIADEIYEHIIYDGNRHISMATLEGMRERTVVINSLSKTYALTGWRLGYTIASPELTRAIKKVHDLLTVGTAAPLQEAGAVALELPLNYYEALIDEYQWRRDYMVGVLRDAGFNVSVPEGAYYIMADVSNFGFDTDLDFANFLVKESGVAVVPGSCFYSETENGSQYVRISFSKRRETLQAAADRLLSINEKLNHKGTKKNFKNLCAFVV